MKSLKFTLALILTAALVNAQAKEDDKVVSLATKVEVDIHATDELISAMDVKTDLRGTCILVRSHNPTQAMVDRIVAWQLDVVAAGGFLMASVDSTSPRGRLAVERLSAALGSSHLVHSYTETMLVRAYPVLNELRDAMHVAAPQWKRWAGGPEATLAWGFHNEALGLWYNNLGAERRESIDYVWVMEDDVGVAGGLPELVAEYQTDAADLLGASGDPVSTGWVWHDVVSAEYARRYPLPQRRFAPEMVQRFSTRLLVGLHTLSREEGVSAWSEQATPTLCRHLDFRCSTFRPENLGERFHGGEKRFTREEWNDIIQEVRDEDSARLYHALKF
mgnify:CR=1 FL=1